MNATPPMSFPRERGSPVQEVPLSSQGPTPFFPPVCLQSHWDPTAILARTLPAGYAGQPLDPRPWTRICLNYTTAGDDAPAPAVDPNLVLPSGGQFYPPGRYAASIDNESQLRRLDRPLGTCEGNQWEPSLNSDMFNSRILVPRNSIPSDPSRIQEVAFPKTLLRAGPYDCREANDRMNMMLASEYNFNNATKQDKYKVTKKPHRAGPPDAPLSGSTQTMRPDLVFDAGRPLQNDPRVADKNPTRSYAQEAANERADLIANAQVPSPKTQQVFTPPVNTIPFAPNVKFSA